MDPGPRPGRPRGFDPDATLRAALDLFWARGFEATGIEDLTLATGLSRSSLYATYGSKHGVLLAALGWYCETAAARLEGVVARAPDRRGAARAVLAAIVEPDGDRRGCFFVNCLTELAPHDPGVEALARAQIARYEALLADLLGCGADRARALLGLAYGMTLLRKAGLAAPALAAALDQVDPLLGDDARG